MIREPATYFARTIVVRSGAETEYIALLEEYVLPIWDAMRQRGTLSSMETIRLTRDLKRDARVPDWHLVQVGCVPGHLNGTSFFDTEKLMLGDLPLSIRQDAARFATNLRCESLRTTPNSHSPVPIDSLRIRRDDVRLSVECIQVRQEALERYQQLMILNAGPAIRELRDGGFVYSFTPLETDEVVLQAEDMPQWNQLHVLALLPENMESFTSAFSDAISRANPKSGGYDGYFRDLDDLRERPRWSLGRYLSELRVTTSEESSSGDFIQMA
jgi:hypothetical protein